MKTGMHSARRFVYAFGWTALAVAACVQQQPSNPSSATADQTQVQVGQIVPGSGANTGIVAGTGNTVSGTVPGMPSLQNIALTLSIAASTAPDLCLSVPDAAAAQNALVLRSCSNDPLQKWVYVSGVMQSSQGQCLAIDTANNNAATLAACDVNNINQQLTWSGGQLNSLAVAGQQMVLQVPAAPATSTSAINFAPFDIARISQQRWTLAQREHDSTQTLITHGVSLSVMGTSAICLTAQDTLGYVNCVAADANQKWMLTDTGFFQNEGTKKCLGGGGANAAMIDCNAGPSVAWNWHNGLVQDVNTHCLDADGTSIALKACDQATSRHFIFGLSKGQ